MKKKILNFLLLFILFTSLPAFADIVVIKVEGVVNPVMSEFISFHIDTVTAENSEALVIELDTPGGLDTSMRSIVKKITSSEVPVIVYIAPGGARAASAGVFITMAAHVAAMAPGTNIGAAHPVGIGGQMDKKMIDKVTNDAAAYIKTLAQSRNRNAVWAESAVRDSVSITEQEALNLKVIDYVSADLDTLLTTINGNTVKTLKGEIKIDTKGKVLSRKTMGMRHKILSAISHPEVAYLLMLLGFYGIFFELSSPGTIFPGVIGAVSLILAFYSFQTLPVNYAGLLLIVLAIVLFLLEIKITSFGLLSLGGVLSLTLGSIMLFDSPLPFYNLSLKVILPAVILTSLFFILTIGLIVKAYRRKPLTGAEGMVGLEGIAKTDIHEDGQVFVNGELWNASSTELISTGEKIFVEKEDHLRLHVRKKANR
ncbi:MAG: nodulation protein NfeD [Nitrospira sp.]|nr:nodulation protein NfeD [bacterium]MBL7049901.1 nodulation protein NfeD [Nitrospira sp.]